MGMQKKGNKQTKKKKPEAMSSPGSTECGLVI